MKQGSRRNALIKGPLYYTYMYTHSYPPSARFDFFFFFFFTTNGQVSCSVHKKNTDQKITLHYFKNQVLSFLTLSGQVIPSDMMF